MDELKIERAVLIGLSMGGYIALRAIQRQPERIAGLILCDTQCAADSEEGREKRKKTIAFIQKNGLSVYAEESLKNLFAPASFTAKKDQVTFIQDTILKTPASTICLTLQALADRKETCSSLTEIKVPVCILVGKEDKITSPELASKMQVLIKDSTLHIIEGAGHLSNLENPEQFNTHVKNFLAML
jgi:pimeloyl-ACP methyl ester carboxylesterase